MRTFVGNHKGSLSPELLDFLLRLLVWMGDTNRLSIVRSLRSSRYAIRLLIEIDNGINHLVYIWRENTVGKNYCRLLYVSRSPFEDLDGLITWLMSNIKSKNY